MTINFVAELKRVDPMLFSRLNQEINADAVFNYLQPIADTYAPSQTVSYTRARVIKQLLAQAGLLNQEKVQFETNFQATGNAVILLGENPSQKKVWLLAHLDIISYLIEPEVSGRYPLTPLCLHLMVPGEAPGIALAYDLLAKQYQVVSEGKIITENDQNVFFLPDGPGQLRAGQRVCFASQLTWDRESGQVQGSIDDSAGAAALILATRFLAKYDIELLLGLTDEEEGVAGDSNQTICRGGARLLQHFDQPELVIVSDVQEPIGMDGSPIQLKPGEGAIFAEKASRNRGEITPPHLYELVRQLASDLDAEGIRLRENSGGYVSRTEGVNAMLRSPNILLLGFLGNNRHFQEGPTTANIHDLVDLARTVVCAVLLTQTGVWQEVMCGE